MDPDPIIVRIANEQDSIYALAIANETEASALARGSGIAKRSPESIIKKMTDGHAVIAISASGSWAGYSYIETWNNGEFVSNSGLIVHPAYRQLGVAKAIKEKTFSLCRKLYPNAKIFSITTGPAIMKINARLGFEAVSFNDITQDQKFWSGCESCVNHDILQRKAHKHCLCTALLYDPAEKQLSPSIY